MGLKVLFGVENVDVVGDVESDSQFITASIEAFASGENLHGFICSEEVLRATAETLYEKPVSFGLDFFRLDFGGHDESMVNAGFIVPDSATFVRKDDGRLVLKVLAKIWKKYSSNFIEIMDMSVDKRKSVSVEMDLFEFGDKDENDLVPMLSFVYTAVVILGDRAQPAVPGANMKLLSFSAGYSNDVGLYRTVELGVTDEMIFSVNEAIDKCSSAGLNVPSESVFASKHILEDNRISIDVAQRIDAFFRSHNYSSEDVDPVVWGLYGGNEAMEVFKSAIEEITSIDNGLLKYFEESVPDVLNSEGREEIVKMEKEKSMDEAIEEEMQEEVSDEEESEDVADSDVEDGAESEEETEQVTMASEDGDENSPVSTEEFSLTAREIDRQLNHALEDMEDNEYEYWVETHDEEYAYVYCYMDGKTYRMKYEIMDENKVVIHVSMDEEVIYSPMLIEKAEAQKREFEALVKFRDEVEEKRLRFEVDRVLSEVKQFFTRDEFSLEVDSAKTVTLDGLTGWKNEIKARAFEKSNVKDKKNFSAGEETFVRVDTVFSTGGRKDSIWEIKEG